MFRFISKPFKRWAFNRAKTYTHHYIKIYNKKYIIKFLNKRKKLAKLKNNDKLITLIDKLNNKDLLNNISNHFNSNVIYKTKEEECLFLLINTYLLNTSDIVNIYNHVFIIDFVNYIINLNNINKKDLGLDHSKVREYWLKRGPRIFITSIIFVVSNYLLYRYLKNIDYYTNIYLISINIITLLLSFYMLYFRLPDSIESAVARTTHDYYVKYKENLSLMV